MKSFFTSLPFRLLLAIALGITVGLLANDGVINVVQSIRHLSAQLVFFSVPLIIVGFVASSIARSGRNASRLLGISLGIGYGSAVGAALFATLAGFLIIPRLNIPSEIEGLRPLPQMLFELNIPPVIPTMSALALAIFLGLAATWTKATATANLLDELQRIVEALVRRVIIPILPVFIGATFALLAFQGRLTRQLPIFLQAIGAVIALQLLWIAILYVGATLFPRRDPREVIRHYGAPYVTALGTMSSAATLPVALRGARKSSVLNDRVTSFGVPLLAHVHMPGSTVAISFLLLTVSSVIYGGLPPVGTMLLFVFLLGIFAVAAPGVPGGTLMASLGLVTAVIGFGETAVALMLAVFALQDSFGTSTNITSDGPVLMALSKKAEKWPVDEASPFDGVVALDAASEGDETSAALDRELADILA